MLSFASPKRPQRITRTRFPSLDTGRSKKPQNTLGSSGVRQQSLKRPDSTSYQERQQRKKLFKSFRQDEGKEDTDEESAGNISQMLKGEPSDSHFSKMETILKSKVTKKEFFSLFKQPMSKIDFLNPSNHFKNLENNRLPAIVQTSEFTRVHKYVKTIASKNLNPVPATRYFFGDVLVMINISVPDKRIAKALGSLLKEYLVTLSGMIFRNNGFSDLVALEYFRIGFDMPEKLETSLTSFYFESNQITAATMNAFEASFALPEFAKKISTLSFSGSQISSFELQKRFFVMLKRTSQFGHFSRISLNKFAISDFAMKNLEDFLMEGTQQLTHLNLSETKLTSQGINRVLGALRESSGSLVTLKLAGINLNSTSVVLLVSLLENNFGLSHLDLSNCNLNDKSAQPLFEVLFVDYENPNFPSEKVNVVTSVHLSNNEFDDGLIENLLKNLNNFKGRQKDKEELPGYPEMFSLGVESIAKLKFLEEDMDLVWWEELFDYRFGGSPPKKETICPIKISQPNMTKGIKLNQPASYVPLILQRFIDKDISSAGKWFASPDCYYCQRWTKCYIIVQDPMSPLPISESSFRGDSFLYLIRRTLPKEPKGFDIQFKGVCQEWFQCKFLEEAIAIQYTSYLPPGLLRFTIAAREEPHVSVLAEDLLNVPFRKSDLSYDFEEFKGDKIRVFDKSKSSFRGYQELNEVFLGKMLQNDLKNCKLHKVLTKQDINEIAKEFRGENYKKMYYIYLYYASISNFPTIKSAEFKRMLNDANMIDGKMTMNAFDLLFSAVNSEGTSEANPEKEFCRFEFFEFFIRAAMVKYKEKLKASSVAACALKYMEETIFENSPSLNASEEYRKMNVHTVHVEQAIINHRTKLIEVFRRFKRSEHYVTFESFKMLLKEMGYNVNDRDLIPILAMTKSPIVDELKGAQYFKMLTFEEFLEMTVRFSLFIGNVELEGERIFARMNQFFSEMMSYLKIK